MFNPGELVKVISSDHFNEEIGLIIKQEGKFMFSDCYLVLVGNEVYPYREYEIKSFQNEEEIGK